MNRRSFLRTTAAGLLFPSLPDHKAVAFVGPPPVEVPALLWFDENPEIADVWEAIDRVMQMHEKKLGLTELLHGTPDGRPAA